MIDEPTRIRNATPDVVRVRYRGLDGDRFAILIDSDEHGTVVSCEVDLHDLQKAIAEQSMLRRIARSERERAEAVRKFIAGRQMKTFVPTHRIMHGSLSTSELEHTAGFDVELLAEWFDDASRAALARIIFRNGYTMVVSRYDIEQIRDEE